MTKNNVVDIKTRKKVDSTVVNITGVGINFSDTTTTLLSCTCGCRHFSIKKTSTPPIPQYTQSPQSPMYHLSYWCSDCGIEWGIG